MRTLLAFTLLAAPVVTTMPATATCPVEYVTTDLASCLPVAADPPAAGARCELTQTGHEEYLLSGGPVVVPGAASVTFSCVAHELTVEETRDGPVAYMDPRTLTYPVHPMYICTQVYWTTVDGRPGGADLGCYWRG